MKSEQSILNSISINLDDHQVDFVRSTLHPGITETTVHESDLEICATETIGINCTVIRCALAVNNMQTLQLQTNQYLCCLFFSYQGEIMFKFNGTRHRTHPYHYNLVQVPPGQYELQCQHPGICDLVILVYPVSMLFESHPSHPQLKQFIRNIGNVDMVFPLYPWFIPASLDFLIAMHGIFRKSDPNMTGLRNEPLMLHLLSRALQPLEESLPDAFKNIDSKEMGKVYLFVDHVLAILDRPITFDARHHSSISHLIDLLGTTNIDLARNFRTMFGDTPYHFLNLIRMKRALELINTYSYSLPEVAMAVGYKGTKSFKKAFVSIHGEQAWSSVKTDHQNQRRYKNARAKNRLNHFKRLT